MMHCDDVYVMGSQTMVARWGPIVALMMGCAGLACSMQTTAIAQVAPGGQSPVATRLSSRRAVLSACAEPLANYCGSAGGETDATDAIICLKSFYVDLPLACRRAVKAATAPSTSE